MTWLLRLTLLGLCWQVAIEKQKVHVGVKGQPAILDGELYAAVKPDDSFWNSDGTALELTLQKVSAWPEAQLSCSWHLLCS